MGFTEGMGFTAFAFFVAGPVSSKDSLRLLAGSMTMPSSSAESPGAAAVKTATFSDRRSRTATTTADVFTNEN